MSEQLKQELEADTDRLETGTVAGSETIGEQEEKPTEGKLEAQEDDESKEEDTVPMGKASLADIVSGIPAPTKEEVEAAEAENAKPVKQKAREKLEAEKKKAIQKNFADPVITYLMKRCEEDQGLAEDVMQEGKTWNNSHDTERGKTECKRDYHRCGYCTGCILGTLSGSNNKLLLCGNPTRTSGTFYDSHTRDRALYKCHTVSSADSSRTNKENIDSLIRKYGWDSNVVRVRVRGEFPNQEDDVFIPLSLIEQCSSKLLELDDAAGMQFVSLGVDVARFGDDETIIYRNYHCP